MRVGKAALALPQKKDGDKEVRQWLQRYGGDSAQRINAIDGDGENIGARSEEPEVLITGEPAAQRSSISDSKPVVKEKEIKKVKKEFENDYITNISDSI